MTITAKTITVIETNLTTRGKGTQSSPLRRITEYWSAEGQLLAEHDPHTPCCNERGHIVKVGAPCCDHCGATLKEILRQAVRAGYQP